MKVLKCDEERMWLAKSETHIWCSFLHSTNLWLICSQSIILHSHTCTPAPTDKHTHTHTHTQTHTLTLCPTSSTGGWPSSWIYAWSELHERWLDQMGIPLPPTPFQRWIVGACVDHLPEGRVGLQTRRGMSRRLDAAWFTQKTPGEENTAPIVLLTSWRSLL